MRNVWRTKATQPFDSKNGCGSKTSSNRSHCWQLQVALVRVFRLSLSLATFTDSLRTVAAKLDSSDGPDPHIRSPKTPSASLWKGTRRVRRYQLRNARHLSLTEHAICPAPTKRLAETPSSEDGFWRFVVAPAPRCDFGVHIAEHFSTLSQIVSACTRTFHMETLPAII